MVGGSASFYYNDKSDIDVHLIVDKKKLGSPKLIDDFLQDRKALWSLKHKVTVKGYPLEPYCQDIHEVSPHGQGVYSLRDNHWVHRPVEIDYDPSTDTHLDPKIEHWKRVIDKAIQRDYDDEVFERIKSKLRQMRSAGLTRGGETDPLNFVYKALRNEGYIDRINNYISARADRRLTL